VDFFVRCGVWGGGGWGLWLLGFGGGRVGGEGGGRGKGRMGNGEGKGNGRMVDEGWWVVWKGYAL